ncbi:Sm-like protein LSM6A [Smittium culicis]|uniref:Sm-like protein LSM6A n=1 Tax=Smittium culicis TaxID=133412 RepID=A0A1R1Y340_9FUNG|nr:Sm-like protein LSM6A [Smittium culicis]OMJ21260.1 Sm-like protein LSM6A [Smittium culicis]
MENNQAQKSPSEYLKNIIGSQVVVRLNSGIDYKGTLACLDGYMNITMENTEEYFDGVLKNSYGDAFIRGNNGMFFSLFNVTNTHLLDLIISPIFLTTSHTVFLKNTLDIITYLYI